MNNASDKVFGVLGNSIDYASRVGFYHLLIVFFLCYKNTQSLIMKIYAISGLNWAYIWKVLNMNEQLYHYFEEVDSTNELAKKFLAKGKVIEGTMLRASYQNQGRGQLQVAWESRKGNNILASVILHPHFLPVEKQFYLNRIAALAVADFLCLNIADEVQIKWPNDILVNGEKLCGILIENTLVGNKIENCIIGVGININQTKFQNYIPPASSLYNLTYREYDIEQCALIFHKCLMNRYKQLKEGLFKILLSDFNKLLYGKGLDLKYKAKGEIINASVQEVKDDGVIVLKVTNGKIVEFRNKELEYLFS